MTIKTGDKIPSATLMEMQDGKPTPVNTDNFFAGKKVALFALPGAFTPTCSMNHLPGYLKHAAEIRAKGVDTIACMAVNDSFVMDAWGRDKQVGDRVLMLADGNAAYTRALGLELDASGFGMGQRSQRFAIVVKNGVVAQLHVEAPREFKVSAAENILKNL